MSNAKWGGDGASQQQQKEQTLQRSFYMVNSIKSNANTPANDPIQINCSFPVKELRVKLHYNSDSSDRDIYILRTNMPLPNSVEILGTMSQLNQYNETNTHYYYGGTDETTFLFREPVSINGTFDMRLVALSDADTVYELNYHLQLILLG